MASDQAFEHHKQLAYPIEITPEATEKLRPLAKYVWWKTTDETLRFPARLIAQVMNLGTFEDAVLLCQAVTEDTLRGVLTQAEVGQFTPRSWHYWHYRLNLCLPGEVPPMPVRKVA